MSGPAERILEIVRRALERRDHVEIDGLGVFRRTCGGGCEFIPETRPRAFIAYVQEDLALARRLCRDLAAAGCAPWLDREQLLPGQNWPRAIERAISVADAFVACFSPRALVKRGQFQSELRYALQCASQVPPEGVFLIPVRLEPCQVPREIARQWQYTDLFPDWGRGVERIAAAVHQAGAGRIPPLWGG
jgi:hypothetical protein